MRRPAEQLEDPLRGAGGAQRFGGEPRRVAEPARDEQRVQDERDQRACGQPAGDDEASPDPDGEERGAFAGDERHAAKLGRRYDLASRELERPRDLAIVTRALGRFL